jgi:hypothetical protein
VVSVEGESYEQWLERTAPRRVATAAESRLWDVAVVALLAVFSVWLGGTGGWIGLGLVALLAAELVLVVVVSRGVGNTRAPSRLPLYVRGASLLATLLMSGWLISIVGAEAIPMPLLLLTLDLKDNRSFLRWALERLR